MAHVSPKKKQELSSLKGYFSKYPIVGIVDLTNLPSKNLQKIRGDLRKTVFIRVTKKRLIKILIPAFKDSIKNIEALEAHLEHCAPALLFTAEDPFKLAKQLAKSKSKAPAKAGQMAPYDIVIPKG